MTAARTPRAERLTDSGRHPGRHLAVGTAILGVLGLAALFVPGWILDAPQPAPPPSDAIVVISGDEQLARFREGVRLFRDGLGHVLVFSGAARDTGPSNADVMRKIAVREGVPAQAILEDSLGKNTWGNAIYTRRLLEQHGLHSAILVTSPYHVRRAEWTFNAAYAGSGIRLAVHEAPDSEWRKLSWWDHAATRSLTFSELLKLAYIAVTGHYERAPGLPLVSA